MFSCLVREVSPINNYLALRNFMYERSILLGGGGGGGGGFIFRRLVIERMSENKKKSHDR